MIKAKVVNDKILKFKKINWKKVYLTKPKKTSSWEERFRQKYEGANFKSISSIAIDSMIEDIHKVRQEVIRETIEAIEQLPSTYVHQRDWIERAKVLAELKKKEGI